MWLCCQGCACGNRRLGETGRPSEVEESGVDRGVCVYRGAGHFSIDPVFRGHAPAIAELASRRVLKYLHEGELPSQ